MPKAPFTSRRLVRWQFVGFPSVSTRHAIHPAGLQAPRFLDLPVRLRPPAGGHRGPPLCVASGGSAT